MFSFDELLCSVLKVLAIWGAVMIVATIIVFKFL